METSNSNFHVTDKILASAGKRLANFIIDYIVKNIVLFILFFIIILIDQFLGDGSIAFWAQSINKLEEMLIGFVLLLVYYTVMESVTKGRTIGKYITNTKVVDKKGNSLGSDVILKRTLCRIIPFDAFSFLGNNPRGWHDSLSDTYVIDVKKFQAEKQKQINLNELGNN